MARLSKRHYPGPWDQPDPKKMEDWKTRWDEEFSVLWGLQRAAQNLPPGQVVGLVLSFPVADSAAFYLVVKESPLTLQHIPCGDAWRADPILIRGLRKQDLIFTRRAP